MNWLGNGNSSSEFSIMRVLPWFVGAAVVVAVGGAVVGAAISTTPRQIHDSPTALTGASIISGGQDARGQTLSANHYPLETQGETYEVGELRERGLYSQDRFAPRYYVGELDERDEQFDFAAADAAQRAWETEQQPALGERRMPDRQARPASTRPLERQRPAKAHESEVTFVSRPVVQDTSTMARR